MPDKVDHLSTCNDQNVPHQDFDIQFCQRCIQPECTRSQHGKSRFEQRALNWESRLFLNVPRMDSSDERFQTIAGKRFLSVAGVQPQVQSAWLDPREDRPVQVQVPVQLEAPEPAPLELVPIEKPAPPPAIEKVAENPVPTGEIRNTPARPRQMIGGAEPKPSVPVLDPWQATRPQPLRPGETLVQPGARIKFGG